MRTQYFFLSWKIDLNLTKTKEKRKMKKAEKEKRNKTKYKRFSMGQSSVLTHCLSLIVYYWLMCLSRFFITFARGAKNGFVSSLRVNSERNPSWILSNKSIFLICAVLWKQMVFVSLAHWVHYLWSNNGERSLKTQQCAIKSASSCKKNEFKNICVHTLERNSEQKCCWRVNRFKREPLLSTAIVPRIWNHFLRSCTLLFLWEK